MKIRTKNGIPLLFLRSNLQEKRQKTRDIPAVPALPPLPLPALPARQSTTPTTSSKGSSNTLFDACPTSPDSASAMVLERKIFACIEEVKVQVHLHTRLLQAMATKIDSIGNADDLEEKNLQGIDIIFPISTKGDLLHANNLLENEDHRRKLVKSLKTIGGKSVKASVRRLLAHMISNQVAQQINWLGKGGDSFFKAQHKYCPSNYRAEEQILCNCYRCGDFIDCQGLVQVRRG